MEAKEQLKRLLRVQELALEIRAARNLVENAPRRVEEIEANFRERNAEFVAVQNQHEELQTDQRNRTADNSQLELQLKKYQGSLMAVKNQREYSAMLREIDTVKAEISDNEEAILKDMEGIERLVSELETHAEHIKQERENVAAERKSVEESADEARNRIEALTADRGQIEGELPRDLIATVHRLEAKRQGKFLSKAVDGTCESCFVRVRPQVFQEVRMAKAVHACSNCRRVLYSETVLREADEDLSAGEGGTPTEPGEASGVEALNGGTV